MCFFLLSITTRMFEVFIQGSKYLYSVILKLVLFLLNQTLLNRFPMAYIDNRNAI